MLGVPGLTVLVPHYAESIVVKAEELVIGDIIDINAGSHGKYFATNFDPEINFREFTGQVWSWQNSQWTSNKMFEVKRTDDLPVVGSQTTR